MTSLSFLSNIIPIIIAIAVVVIAIVAVCKMYKVAPVDKALIVTGGKEPKVKISGGAFVVPIFRKAQYFDLCMLTVTAEHDNVQSATSVQVLIDWTAQIRPDIRSEESLMKAIVSFKERNTDGIIADVRCTLTGAIRDIIASMTPEEVLKDKAGFTARVEEIVSDEMSRMGLELVSLNMQEISDDNGYYQNIATLDMEDKRLAAENKKAVVLQEVRTQKAQSEQLAAENELASELAVAAKQRENNIKMAEFKAETDKAQADADIAGRLQKTIREQELAAQEGRINVIRQEQANLEAQKRKDVVATEAEAEKRKREIESEAEASMRKISADADVQVAQKQAEAVKISADASAEKITREGNAEAEVIRQKGIATAEAEKAKMLAQAEGEKALAEARASNEKVNYEIEKLKIDANARIEIATKTATIMAELGKNAEFVNIGGSAQGNNTGNVLLDTLSGIPALMKTLNAENHALNDKPFNDELKNLVSSVFEPVKGVLATNVSQSNANSEQPIVEAGKSIDDNTSGEGEEN